MKVTDNMLLAASAVLPSVDSIKLRECLQAAIDSEPFLAKMEYVTLDPELDVSNRYNAEKKD